MPYSMYGLILELLYGGAEVNSIMSVSVPMVFVLLFGTEIYRQMGTDGIYFFSRQRSRQRWYLRVSIRLLFYTLTWCMLQFGITLLTVFHFLPGQWNREYAVFVMLNFAGMVMFDFLLVYLVNVLSMCIGSTLAFVSTYMGCAASFYIGTIRRMTYASRIVINAGENPYTVGSRWMYLLPSELLQPRWDGEPGALLHDLSLYRRTMIGMGVIGIVLGGIFIVGLLAVRHMDIGLTDKERIF